MMALYLGQIATRASLSASWKSSNLNAGKTVQPTYEEVDTSFTFAPYHELLIIKVSNFSPFSNS